MAKNKKLRGYSLICSDDNLVYDFVIAYNIKEAKKLMIKNCNDWICNYDEPFISFYAKWNKEADISNLKWGEHVEDINLLKRNICSRLEYSECPICKNKKTVIYKDDELNKIGCNCCLYGE